MAVTGRFLNSTMPFRGPPLKGSFDKSIHTNPPPTEQDFKHEVKVGKEPSVAPYNSALARVITHGTAEQVGTQSFRSPKHTCQFIAQAQCEYYGMYNYTYITIGGWPVAEASGKDSYPFSPSLQVNLRSRRSSLPRTHLPRTLTGKITGMRLHSSFYLLCQTQTCFSLLHPQAYL